MARSFSIIAHFRGEDPVVDQIERRIEQIGLGHRHARDLQLLSYEEGVSYNDHTDCFYKSKVTDHDKTATFLGYLQDGTNSDERSDPFHSQIQEEL